jgi:hypothetical protein
MTIRFVRQRPTQVCEQEKQMGLFIGICYHTEREGDLVRLFRLHVDWCGLRWIGINFNLL